MCRAQTGSAQTLGQLPIIVPIPLRLKAFPSLQVFFIFCACFHRQYTRPSSSHQGHHSAGFDKCHFFFLKVALEKGNLTAVRQNRELNTSRPLSTRAQPKNKMKKTVAGRGPELLVRFGLALPRDLCAEPKALPRSWGLGVQVSSSPCPSPNPLSSAACFLAGN